ncbi:MAG: hypothetical protein K6G64_04345 [Eubacterium sp.]|nr:hypothetical protein [Eubacterium sp.]
MKKNIFALLLTFVMIFACSTICFAASSPVATVLPADDEKADGSGSGTKTKGDSGSGVNGGNTGNQNTSSVSPKTGYELGGSLVVMMTALGVAVVSMKKYSEC